jgi:VanZ family protein
MRRRSSAAPLAAVALLLVVYASLYPFEGWRWPAGSRLLELISLPWPRWTTRFDDASNLLGYALLGAALFTAAARSGFGAGAAWVGAALLPTLLSWLLETLQHFVPGRVPSARDLALNAGGAVLGSALAALLQAAGVFDRWHALRERWFVARGSSGAVALLALWPVALLFPAPVPLGLGQLFDDLRLLAQRALEGSAWAEPLLPWVLPDAGSTLPLSPLREGVAIALGLLAPCLLAIVVTRPGFRRAVMVLGAGLLAAAVTTLSTALNFGPAHALTWLTPVSTAALAGGTLVALACCLMRPPLAAACALMVTTSLVVLVAQAPADPYFAASLQQWEQGRFIRFHGLAQWVGWLWPYAALVWLLLWLSASRRPE